MKRYNIVVNGISDTFEHPEGIWVRYEDVMKHFSNPMDTTAQAYVEKAESFLKRKPTFRDYVIAKHGSYPPTVQVDVFKQTDLLTLIERMAEWVEM